MGGLAVGSIGMSSALGLLGGAVGALLVSGMGVTVGNPPGGTISWMMAVNIFMDPAVMSGTKLDLVSASAMAFWVGASLLSE